MRLPNPRTGDTAPCSNGSRLRVTHTGDPHITRPSVALHATRQTHVTTGSRSQTDGAGDVALQAWARCAPNVLRPQPLVAHSGVRARHRSGLRVFRVRRTAAVQVSICAAPDLGSENEAKNCNVGCVAQCCRLNGPGAQYVSGVLCSLRFVPLLADQVLCAVLQVGASDVKRSSAVGRWRLRCP